MIGFEGLGSLAALLLRWTRIQAVAFQAHNGPMTEENERTWQGLHPPLMFNSNTTEQTTFIIFYLLSKCWVEAQPRVAKTCTTCPQMPLLPLT